MNSCKYIAACTIMISSLVGASAAHCQIKPETSGTTSFYEPEPNPHHEGWYRPRVPGKPSVSRHTRRFQVPTRYRP